MGVLNNQFHRIGLYADNDYKGAKHILSGNIGIRDLSDHLGGVDSFRLRSSSSSATIVFFSKPDFAGIFKIYRGSSLDLCSLDSLIGPDDARSVLSSCEYLSLEIIRRIAAGDCEPLQGFEVIKAK
ncbi:hypothetical protein M3223_20800 [Paenibacillus pasadenensis]|uniref:hypothetical protein n=1 Tax=Paenibacillus pasadenensis TaxID=217090 RepID=UPI0020407648|nr:hypothetical protein [Paenibacillus pasadenensis]MCM3749778.1 hypothetical protein [Paenibacillus pasadenensis]